MLGVETTESTSSASILSNDVSDDTSRLVGRMMIILCQDMLQIGAV
jgi:hypothetical protein